MSGAAAGIIGASIIGLAGTVYSQEQQKKAQEKARNAQKRAEEEARTNEKKIRDASAEVETAASTTFGQDDGDEIGSYDDFISPKASTSLGGTPKTGLNAGGGSSGLGL